MSKAERQSDEWLEKFKATSDEIIAMLAQVHARLDANPDMFQGRWLPAKEEAGTQAYIAALEEKVREVECRAVAAERKLVDETQEFAG